MKMEPIECSETSAYKIQTPGNYPEDNILQIFEKFPNIKFHENPFTGSRVIPCGQTDGRTDGQIDMITLIVAFRKRMGVSKQPTEHNPSDGSINTAPLFSSIVNATEKL
jgi:hypothetical protein